MLRLAPELFPQLRILGGNTHRTGVQVALAHHDAAEGHQRRGGEAKLFRSKKRGDSHVPPSFQLTIGL